MNKKKTGVWLSLNKLHKDVIAEYIKKAEKAGFKQIDFVFGKDTKVSFSILL